MVYKRKYKVNKNELKKYFQDLTELEDWIPYKIRMELHIMLFFKVMKKCYQ